MAHDQRLPLSRISGTGAAVGYVVTWDGAYAKWAVAGGGDSEHNGTGVASTAVGTSALAAGAYGTSVGDGSSASGDESTALGWLSASVINSTSVGAFARVTGSGGGVAVGRNSSVSGTNSVAVGNVASASGNNATSVGRNAQASGASSIALGDASVASALRGIAIGVGTNNAVADRCVIKANDVEVIRSNAVGTGTSLILADTSTGTRYRVAVTGGVLTVSLA